MRRAVDGDEGNLWITAVSQSSGKARRGRHWVSEKGNLFASLLLTDLAAQKDIGTLPFVVSLAVFNAIKVLTGSPKLALKWPNDVLFDGKKISGILLETTLLSNGKSAVIIGCGINCRHFPQETLYPSTSLAAEGYDIAPDMLFERLHVEMRDAFEIWDKGNGFPAIRKMWIKQAVGIGFPIVARFDTHEETGIFIDIDQRGLLVLETPGGQKQVSAADIFFSTSTEMVKNVND